MAKLNAAGSALVYATYLGGSGGDAVRASRWTPPARPMSRALPARPTSPWPAAPSRPSAAASVTPLWPSSMPTGSALVYATYLGGSGADYGNGLAVDAAGQAYVTGLPARLTSP